MGSGDSWLCVCSCRVCTEPTFSAWRVENGEYNGRTPIPTCPISMCHPRAVPFQGQAPDEVQQKQYAGIPPAVITLHLWPAGFSDHH